MNNTPLQSITVRLPTSLVAAVHRAADRRGVTPSEFIRAALVEVLSVDPAASRHQEVLYEIAKTRSVVLRFLDQQLGEQVADQILAVADGDAKTYVQHRQGG